MLGTVVFIVVGGLYMVLCLVLMIALACASARADRRRRPKDSRMLRWDEDQAYAPRHRRRS